MTTLMLHITNGDAVIELFHAAGVPGVYLSWRDSLHDGAVPETSSLEALSEIRARALSGFGWASYGELREDFMQRDRALEKFRDHDETVIWFEHDLYDQLQLLQLLDWFSHQDLSTAHLSIIQLGTHPEVPNFHGLGELTAAQLSDLLPARSPITPKQLEIGRDAWSAFRSTDPGRLVELSKQTDEGMPYLARALRRMLEEYPSIKDGLSRTERQLLNAALSGARHRKELYAQSQKLEDCPWGDASVFLRLDRLVSGRNPALVCVGADEFAITDHGKRVMAGSADWVTFQNGFDTWIGGVHLTESNPFWRWNEDDQTLIEN
jgi:hypothetical protein